MRAPISIALIESDTTARHDGTAVLASSGARVSAFSPSELLNASRSLQAEPPGIIILEVGEIERGVRETEFLASRFPHSAIIVTADGKNSDWIIRLMRAGAVEYLTRPVMADELIEAVRRAVQLHERINGPCEQKGAAFAVYNPSGGMGTTTVAVNLATSLAASGKQVALVDLNPASPDVTTFLDLSPRYTLANAISRKGPLDASYLKSIMVTHASGVQVLNGPADPMESVLVTPELIRETIGVLKSGFEHVVVDCGGMLADCNLAIFDCSDRLLFTTLLSLPALNNAKRHLAAMRSEKIGSGKIHLLVNRFTPRDEIKLSDAEKILDTGTFMTIPNAYAEVKNSINRGSPLAACSPRSAVARAMDELAQRLASGHPNQG